MDKTKTCSCGHTIDSPMVSAKTRYSKMGYFWLSLAFSAMPVEVLFVCQKCGETIETSINHILLEKYRYNSDIIK